MHAHTPSSLQAARFCAAAWFFLGLFFALISLPAQAQCGPALDAPAGGCEQRSPATLSRDGPGLYAGNPIHIFSGNKHQREIDLPEQDGPLGLQWHRVYNSEHARLPFRALALGRGWSHSYSTRAFISETTVQIVQADGSRLAFLRADVEGQPCSPQHPGQGELKRLPDAGWQWRWPGGRLLLFGSDGALREIVEPSGARVAMRYDDDGRLTSVRDPNLRELSIRYRRDDPERIDHVHWEGRRWSYHYDGDRLVRVEAPSQLTTHYHYENRRWPGHLTGRSEQTIPDAMKRRATYAYDAAGRAVLSADHWGGSKVALRLRHGVLDAQGHTELVDADGRVTVYRGHRSTAGWLLTEALGPGCQTCPQSQVRLRYNAQHQITQRDEIDAQRRLLHRDTFRYDLQGRLVETSSGLRIGYRDGSDAIATVERPSRLPGLTARLDIEHDEHGLPIRLQQSGWSPTIDGGAPRAIHREARIHYARMQSRWRVASVQFEHYSVKLPLVWSARVNPIALVLALWAPTAGQQQGPWMEALDAVGAVRRWHDDFGRAVAASSAHHGWRVWWPEAFAGTKPLLPLNADRATRRRNEDGHVAASQLVDGSWLVHQRDAQGRITRLVRTPFSAKWLQQWALRWSALGQPIVSDVVYGTGGFVQRLQHGNGMQSHWLRAPDGSLERLTTTDASGRPLRDHRYTWGTDGNLHALTVDGVIQRFQYDSEGRLITQPIPLPASLNSEPWIHEQGSDGRIHRSTQGSAQIAHFYDTRGLRYKRMVRSPNNTAVRWYVHDEQRKRVAELDHDGRITQQVVWLDAMPVAVIDTAQAPTLPAQPGAWGWLRQWWQRWFLPSPRLLMLHLNHLGAPWRATDTQGTTQWDAHLEAWGGARETKSNVPIDLRLPGQWLDRETGLHYNDHRFYDPRRGRYLEPDPLGYPDGPDPFLYARGNPLRYTDPTGRILFAFDGTSNTKASQTNVFWMTQAYDDNAPIVDASGKVLAASDNPYYVEGPGQNPLDAAIAYSLEGIVEGQLATLDAYIRAKWTTDHAAANTMPLEVTVDIVGFSRGAAAARDFSSQVVARNQQGYYGRVPLGLDADSTAMHCVSVTVRFMGLFDSVLSTALGTFDLRVPQQVGQVSHAVAVNEHRKLFPLESIEFSAGVAGHDANRREMGFIGAHSDIGGGYAGQDASADGGDLSDVALGWMWNEAAAAGLKLRPLAASQRTVLNPILHDEVRGPLWSSINAVFGSDREVKYTQGSVKQHVAVPALGMSTADSRQGYVHQWAQPQGTRVGIVDMDRYRPWLADRGIVVH